MGAKQIKWRIVVLMNGGEIIVVELKCFDDLMHDRDELDIATNGY